MRAAGFKIILDSYTDLISIRNHCLENDEMASDLKLRIIVVKKQMRNLSFFGLKIPFLFPY